MCVQLNDAAYLECHPCLPFVHSNSGNGAATVREMGGIDDDNREDSVVGRGG